MYNVNPIASIIIRNCLDSVAYRRTTPSTTFFNATMVLRMSCRGIWKWFISSSARLLQISLVNNIYEQAM